MGKGKQIKVNDQVLTFYHYKEPLIPLKKGFGFEGVLLFSKEKDKIQCHECGGMFKNLSPHVKSKHNLSAESYKAKYGLLNNTSLLSESERIRRQQTFLRWFDSLDEEKRNKWKRNHLPEVIAARNKLKRKKVVKERMERKNLKGTCPQQLLDKIIECKKFIGHTPSKKEFIDYWESQRYVHLIYQTFGSWTKAVKKAGLQLKERKRSPGKKAYNEQELLDYLREFAMNNQRIPTATDFRRGYLPTYSVYTRKFGSIENARRMAGVYEVL